MNFRYSNILKLALISAIMTVALVQRLQFFNQTGKDESAYERAVTDFIEGKNPYKWTIESYQNPDDPGNHGFAYLPGLLYIDWFLFLTRLATKIPFTFLQKFPVLLADMGVGFLLLKELYKKSYTAAVFGLLIWFFNPYFYFKNNYVYTDPLPIFFMLLALYKLGKDDVLAGTFFGAAVALKTFPLILFPVFLIASKERFKFLLAGAIIGIAISLPFLRDLRTYLQGALFIHGERFIQGRPFLFFISYFYKIELFQIIPFKVYTYLAAFGGWVVVLLAYLALRLKDKYTLSLLSFSVFYLFTPVLNKTYLMWGIPILILSLFELAKKKHVVIYYSGLAMFWGFYYWYLSIWKDGFHIWRP